ncbi:hypothetical protein NDU88_003202 [Pleurodeles waltl]|uniref:Uncharacterized protein n=1 Tax=Pleurodeles waltl TaxID=8319 RepID=A0AAV7KXT4_PLEWA|nr:hypothetical protein NDU88_003202 [Pleurodeles waltl]
MEDAVIRGSGRLLSTRATDERWLRHAGLSPLRRWGETVLVAVIKFQDSLVMRSGEEAARGLAAHSLCSVGQGCQKKGCCALPLRVPRRMALVSTSTPETRGSGHGLEQLQFL